MSNAADMAERHGRVLAELTELGLSLARALHEKAVAAEDPKAATDLTLAFHRISRSVRQSMGLEARLERDRQRAAAELRREDVQEAAQATALTELQVQQRVRARKHELGRRIESLIWHEVEDDETAEELHHAIADHIESEARAETFLDEDIDLQIERIMDALGLALLDDDEPPAADPPASPEPPPDAPSGPDPPPRTAFSETW